MSVPLDVSALGTRVRIDFEEGFDTDAEAGIRSSWADAEVPFEEGVEPDAVVGVPSDHELDELAEALTVRVTLAALEQRRGELVMFHAAGVADDDGRVAAFVGPSGRGKTTLSRELGKHFGYVSDETIAVGAGLAVLPYRKPLSLVRADSPKEQVAPRSLGLGDLPDAPLRLSALAILERDEVHVEPFVEELEFPDAIADLAPQMSYLAELPQPLQTIATVCDRVGGIVRLSYPDASTVYAIVPELLERRPVEAAWEPVPVEAENPEFDLSDVLDAIAFDDRTVVLALRRVHVLVGIAPTIWESLRRGRTTAEIVEDVVAEFGVPADGDAGELVEAALQTLVDAAIIARRA
ncbi:PqqD family peptide modification chaperone [Microbacterium sp.]|uniref:PqqD family peptide modification chaperone n=1 Tax=Microbacterium sp. TaxID=51671 RepID=UPI0033400537